VDAYTGFEPHVGEIRALRTFRIGPGGVLYPLFGDEPWTDGRSRASCRVQAGAAAFADDTHPVPSADCSCGLYAYGTLAAAADYPHARHVLAVVACWGRVIAGTRGIRAEYAGVEAVWTSGTVPPELVAALADRHPGIALYRDRTAMLTEHPLTSLDCYDDAGEPQRTVHRRLLQLAMVAAIVIGLLPQNWTWHNSDARLVWIAELTFVVGAALVVRLTRHDLRARALTLTFTAIGLWLIAPFAGPTGIVLLRLPLLQIAVLGGLQRARVARSAARFPAAISSP
jgi:hypothetical protein